MYVEVAWFIDFFLLFSFFFMKLLIKQIKEHAGCLIFFQSYNCATAHWKNGPWSIFPAYICSPKVWKGWIWLSSNLVENLVKLVKRKVFKCDFKSGLTPVLTLSQLLFTFQQLSSRFLQNLFYLFFRHSLLVWEPGPLDHMGIGGHCPQYT